MPSAPRRVLRQERLVGVAVLEQVTVDGERERQIGPGLDREVQIGLPRE